MVQIRKLHPEFLGPDGNAVLLRIPRKPKITERPLRRSDGRRSIIYKRRLTDYPPPSPQPTQCRLWQGAVDAYGYGSMKQYFPNGSRRTVKVHRWIIEMAEDRILNPAETVLHLCDNPPCYRLDHLKVGTIAENNADARAKGRASPPPINRLYGSDNPNSKDYKRSVSKLASRPERTTAVKSEANHGSDDDVPGDGP